MEFWFLSIFFIFKMAQVVVGCCRRHMEPEEYIVDLHSDFSTLSGFDESEEGMNVLKLFFYFLK